MTEWGCDWIEPLQQILQVDGRVVIVSVASVKGSTPREPGAKMLVSAHRVNHTIGGGHLEYKAIQLARNMLLNDQQRTAVNKVQHFTLGAGLGQCCGGVVNLFFEMVSDKSEWLQKVYTLMSEHQDFVQVIAVENNSQIPRLIVTRDAVYPDNVDDNLLVSMARTLLDKSSTASIKKINEREYVFDPIIHTDFTLFLFGGGHVGEAVIKQLSEQPCVVNWIDTRDDQLPQQTPVNVTAINTDIPEAIINEAPAGSYFLVMTHDHALDQTLAEQILKRDDFNYFGLIGSDTKRKKFEHRLLDRGINAKQLSRMTCPIGISGIRSKRPSAIALAVTAELIQCYEQLNEISMSNKRNNVDQLDSIESHKL